MPKYSRMKQCSHENANFELIKRKQQNNNVEFRTLGFFFFFLRLIFICIAVFLLVHMYVYMCWVLLEARKRVLGPQEIKLKMVVNHHVDSGNWTQVQPRATNALCSLDRSPAPTVRTLVILSYWQTVGKTESGQLTSAQTTDPARFWLCLQTESFLYTENTARDHETCWGVFGRDLYNRSKTTGSGLGVPETT